ncbi:MAG: hypothetical protein R2754_15120 [Microthrixaceae bacterium]
MTDMTTDQHRSPRGGCLCGGLSVGTAVSGMGMAALDAEIAALARVDAAVVARRSLVVAELTRRRGDAAGRLRDAGGMSSRQANKATKTAEGLEKLPKTREALEAGEISTGQAEQLAPRVNTPELASKVRDNEASLLERAKRQGTDARSRSMASDDVADSPGEANTVARRQRRLRMASLWIDPDTGMCHLFAKFDPVTGARVSTNLQAMVDKIWRAENLPGAARTKRRVEQRRADALEALICRNTNTNTNTGTDTNTGTGTSTNDASTSTGNDTNTGVSAAMTRTPASAPAAATAAAAARLMVLGPPGQPHHRQRPTTLTGLAGSPS